MSGYPAEAGEVGEAAEMGTVLGKDRRGCATSPSSPWTSQHRGESPVGDEPPEATLLEQVGWGEPGGEPAVAAKWSSRRHGEPSPWQRCPDDQGSSSRRRRGASEKPSRVCGPCSPEWKCVHPLQVRVFLEY